MGETGEVDVAGVGREPKKEETVLGFLGMELSEVGLGSLELF